MRRQWTNKGAACSERQGPTLPSTIGDFGARGPDSRGPCATVSHLGRFSLVRAWVRGAQITPFWQAHPGAREETCCSPPTSADTRGRAAAALVGDRGVPCRVNAGCWILWLTLRQRELMFARFTSCSRLVQVAFGLRVERARRFGTSSLPPTLETGEREGRVQGRMLPLGTASAASPELQLPVC